MPTASHPQELDLQTILLPMLMRAHPYAALDSQGEEAFFSTHLPGGEVRSVRHVACPNASWARSGCGDALTIFHGPHALIPPGWFITGPNLPPRNHAVTLLKGDAALSASPRPRNTFTLLAPPFPADDAHRLLSAVDTFEARVLPGKFRPSSYTSRPDRANLTDALAEMDQAACPRGVAS